MNIDAFCRDLGGSLSIAVHAQPNAKKSAIAGVHGNSLKIKIAAPAVEGAANEELIRFFSKLLGIPRARIGLKRGNQSREKVLEVKQFTAAQFAAILNATTEKGKG